MILRLPNLLRFILVLLTVALAACNLTAAPATPTASSTAVVIRPTSTPQPSFTPQPTVTPPPTATGIPQPTTTPPYRVAQGGFPPICAVVPTVAAANIRSGPATNFPVLGVLPANNWVLASRINGDGWYQISYLRSPVDGGWVSNTVVSLQQPCVCGPNNCVPVNTPPTFTPAQPTSTFTPPPDACILTLLTPNDVVNMYYQPSPDSGIFAPLAYGYQAAVVGRTNDGWYGFDVAALQAPNVGIYRLRWVRSDARITLSGAKCGTLKIIDLTPPLPYKDCTVTPVNVSSVNIYAQHAYDAGIWGPLNVGSSVPVVGQTPKNWFGAADGWYAVQVNPGINPGMAVGRYALRWLPIDANTQTAGDCVGLPTVTLDP